MDIGCTKALVMMLGDAGQHEVLMTAERLYAAEQRLLLRVEASLVDIVLRDRWNQDNDVDAALKRAKQAARDLRYGDGLILDVDRMAGGIDRPLVLLQDRPLDAMRGIAVGILHALDLHDARTGRPGWPFGKREPRLTSSSRCSIEPPNMRWLGRVSTLGRQIRSRTSRPRATARSSTSNNGP